VDEKWVADHNTAHKVFWRGSLGGERESAESWRRKDIRKKSVLEIHSNFHSACRFSVVISECTCTFFALWFFVCFWGFLFQALVFLQTNFTDFLNEVLATGIPTAETSTTLISMLEVSVLLPLRVSVIL